METPTEDNFTLTDGMLCAGGVEAEATCHVITDCSHSPDQGSEEHRDTELLDLDIETFS